VVSMHNQPGTMSLPELEAMNATLAAMAAAPGADSAWRMFLDVIAPETRQARVARIAADITPPRPEPQLPACDGFVGAGQRCGSCRIHRRIHA